jgi:transcriptional regulator with XRE-family HTH domain
VGKSLRQKRSETLTRLLIEARKEAGMTQAEVAAKLGHGQAYVSKYERGKKVLGVIEFLEVAKALGLDPAEVMRKLQQGEC